MTKGDHNNTVDAQPVSYDRMLGKVVFSIPFLGEISQLFILLMGLRQLLFCFHSQLLCGFAADYLKNKKVVEGK